MRINFRFFDTLGSGWREILSVGNDYESGSESVSQWVSQSVTRSPIELFWTAKKQKNATSYSMQCFEHPPNLSPSFPSRAEIDLHADLQRNINIGFYFRLVINWWDHLPSSAAKIEKKFFFSFPLRTSWKTHTYYNRSISHWMTT